MQFERYAHTGGKLKVLVQKIITFGTLNTRGKVYVWENLKIIKLFFALTMNSSFTRTGVNKVSDIKPWSSLKKYDIATSKIFA